MKRLNESNPPRQRLRSIGAVFAGLAAIVIVTTVTDLVMHATGVFPPAGEPMSTRLWLLATAYRLVYGVAGGYLTARFVPDRPMSHALALGVVGLVASIVGAAKTWDLGPGFGPKWYPLALVVIAVPSAWLGGKLYSSK